jgi:hypothetical protein
MADCPVWYHIEEVIRKNVVKKSTKKYVKQSANERRYMLKDLRNGMTLYNDIKGSRILQTAQDKYITFGMFFKSNQPWTFADIGSRRADRLIESETHIVFAKSMLHALNYTGDEKMFFNWLLKTAIDNNSTGDSPYMVKDYHIKDVVKSLERKVKFYESFKSISAQTNNRYSTLAHNKLTKIEKRVLTVLADCACWDGRTVSIGISDNASAWTDGYSYINIDRKYLKGIRFNWDCDIANLFALLTHELAHTSSTIDTDIHGEDFYESYHDICMARYTSPMQHVLSFKTRMYSAMRTEQNDRDKKSKDTEMKALAEKMGKN